MSDCVSLVLWPLCTQNQFRQATPHFLLRRPFKSSSFCSSFHFRVLCTPMPWTRRSTASGNGQIISIGIRIAVLKSRASGFTITGKSPARQVPPEGTLFVIWVWWLERLSGSQEITLDKNSSLKNHLQLVFIRKVLGPRGMRRWRWGRADAAPEKAPHSSVASPTVSWMWDCPWPWEPSWGRGGESWWSLRHLGPHVQGELGVSRALGSPMYPPHFPVTIRTAKNLYKVPPKKQPALL